MLINYFVSFSYSKQPPADREKYLEKFISGQSRILIATQLLTRGTDVDVDYVINFDLPVDYSEFVHRCGRTGRNGRMGTAITFIDFSNSESYNPAVIRQIALVSALLCYCMFQVSRLFLEWLFPSSVYA